MFKKSVFGLDISDDSIEILSLKKKLFGAPEVVSYGREILKSKIVENGVIKNGPKLGEAIQKLLAAARPKPIKTRYCIFSLPESQVFTTVFRLPAGLTVKEIGNTVPYLAEEVVPFKPLEICYDFKPVFTDGYTQEVFYAAAPNAVVAAYVTALKKIGLRPLAIDLESISSARALLDLNKKSKEAKLLMDVGARATKLSIFDGRGIRQSQIIKIAGNHLTRAIATTLKLSDKEAHDLKSREGFNEKIREGRTAKILQNVFSAAVKEAQKFVDGYQTRHQQRITEIILIGGSALTPGIDRYVADRLSIKTTVGWPLRKVAGSEKIIKLRQNAVFYADVVGLALRGVKRKPAISDINLLSSYFLPPRDASEKVGRKRKKFFYFLPFLAALLISASVTAYVFKFPESDIRTKILSGLKIQPQINGSVNTRTTEDLAPNPAASFTATVPTSTPAPATTTPPATLTPIASTTPTSIKAQLTPSRPEFSIKIQQTDYGYLTVRSGPGTNYPKVGKADSGKIFTAIGQEKGWYEIKFSGKGTGWVSAEYVDKL